MSESMIEKVARAIRDSGEGDLSPLAYVEPAKAARAAIKAMREPTEGMLDSGACYEDPNEYYKGHPVFDEGDISEDIYTAMIDAALNEQVAG